jgi:hypothetical protein
MQIGALIALLRGVTLPFLASISAVFLASVGKMTPGREGYQSTNPPYTNERIPESHESLADSNVRGICSRGNPG